MKERDSELLRDITIGQYFPGNSLIHKLDPRFKIVITVIYIVMLFAGGTYSALAVGAVYTFAAIALSRIKPKMFVKSIKPIMPFLLITAVINLLLVTSGDVLWQWKFLKITEGGVNVSLFMIIRIVLLIAGTDKIMSAQKARGAEIDTGSFITRAKNLVSILVPLFISSFRRADELATAMECRCYNGGAGRTRLRQLKSSLRDYAALFVTVVFLAGVIIISRILP